jgi:biotin carboxylase
MKKFFLLLGKGPAIRSSNDVLEKNYPDLFPVGVFYSEEKSQKGRSLIIKEGSEVEKIGKYIGENQVVGVVNRLDSYILLWAKIVDEFGLHGSSFESVMWFKDKSRMHDLMVKNGLSLYRPESKEVDFVNSKEYLENEKLPVVIKPIMGSKSRGVLVLRDRNELSRYMNRIKYHFDSEKVRRSLNAKEKVLIEEYVEGKQFTFTGFVDESGDVHKIGFERVYRGVDVGQNHQQLVYRTTDIDIDEEVLEEAYKLINKLVKIAGLKSTFVFPDYILSKKGKLILVELNVRAGGFRAEMYKYANGIDFDKIAVQLALGEEIGWEKKFNGSCTAVELWADKSGKINKFDFNIRDKVEGFKQYFSVGDEYISPPDGDKPLVSFFVVGDNSLNKSKELISGCSIEINNWFSNYQ